VGRIWKHLRERFHIVKVRVLHPRIPKRSSVDILRGVPEGSRLSPTLFGIFVADLIHELKVQFPNATLTHDGGVRWIGEILYVDDLCLISTDALELQMMINTSQTRPSGVKRRGRNSMLTEQKSCVLKPHKPAMRENDHNKLMAALFGQRHSTSSPCTQTTPTPQSGLTANQDIYPHSCKR